IPMRKHHPKNERIKRRYFAYLEEAKRMQPTSVDDVAAALAAFEASTQYRDFARFHIEQARKFKRELCESTNSSTGKPLAKSTIRSRLMACKGFFQWLAWQPGYKSKISYSDAEYFNLAANDTRIATAKRERPVPSMEQISYLLVSKKSETDIEKRDRALIAGAILIGVRDDALASLSLRHIDLDKRTVFQDARSVRTKNRKTFTSWFFPVGDDIEEIFTDWIAFLTTERRFGPDDLVFPATHNERGADGYFRPVGLERRHWKNADSIRRIFRVSFEAAGLPYFNPHAFRKTLAQLGERLCTTPEEFKAWSQNLGHQHVLTTFTSYGTVSGHRQRDLLGKMRQRANARNAESAPDDETVQRVFDHLLRKKAS
ncbi:MAG: site-specific integrase, partial [Methyloligellaceae bacterium]